MSESKAERQAEMTCYRSFLNIVLYQKKKKAENNRGDYYYFFFSWVRKFKILLETDCHYDN